MKPLPGATNPTEQLSKDNENCYLQISENFISKVKEIVNSTEVSNSFKTVLIKEAISDYDKDRLMFFTKPLFYEGMVTLA